MAVQLIRKVRDRQPQRIAGIDRIHPASDGLGLVVVGGIPCNLANGIGAEVLGAPLITPSVFGKAYGPFATGSDRLRFRAPLPSSGGKGGCILVSFLRPPSGGSERIIAAENGSTVLIVFVESNGTVSVFFRGYRYGFDSLYSSFQAGAPVTFIISSSDWSSGNAANCTLFINRIRYSSEVYYIGTYSLSYDDDRMSVGSNSVGDASPNIRIFMLAYWPDRHITEALAKSLSSAPWQIFEPEVIPLFFSTVTAQFLRPISDVSNSGWTASSGSDLFSMLNETVRNDATYISATAVGATFEVLLGTSAGDPASSINHLPRIAMSAGAGGIILRLKQNTTTIKEWTYASLATSDTLYEPTLTAGEIDSISDYTNLRLYGETIA